MLSTNEGFPLAVFEAMAARLPLLLSDINPLKSIVKDNAIYFPLNDVEMVAGLLMEILEKKLSEMALKARQYPKETVKKDIYVRNLINNHQQAFNEIKPYKSGAGVVAYKSCTA